MSVTVRAPGPGGEGSQALLTAAEAWGRDRGAEVVRLDTYADSPVSVPFYEQRMGYQRRSIVFQKPLRSVLLERPEHVLHNAPVPVIVGLTRSVDPDNSAEFFITGRHRYLVRHIS